MATIKIEKFQQDYITDRKPINIDSPNLRVEADEYRDDMEDLLLSDFETLLRLAHAEGLLYGFLKRVGWKGGRCSCGCEEARFAGRPSYHRK